MRTCAVCIVSHNTRELLRSCLESVVTEGPDEVIVVDNASIDGSAEMVLSAYPSVRLIESDRNLGYGAAANRAIAATRADDILLLNADTVLKPDSLRVLRAQLEDDGSAAVLGPRTLNPDGTPQTSCFHFPTPLHVFLHLSGLYRWIPRLRFLRSRSLQTLTGTSPTVVPWVLGSALAFQRETFEAQGGFDETFFMYFEEVDLCLRVTEDGGCVRFVPAAEIVHTGGASTRQQHVAMRIEYFVSLARFYRKHYSRRSLAGLVAIVRFFAILRLLRALLKWSMRDEASRTGLRSELAINRHLLRRRWERPRNDRIAPAVC